MFGGGGGGGGVVDWSVGCFVVVLVVCGVVCLFVFFGGGGGGLKQFPVSTQDGIAALTKVNGCSPLSVFPSLPLKQYLDLFEHRWFQPQMVERPPLFSTSLSFRMATLFCSGLSLFRKFLEHLSTSALSSCRLVVMSAVLTSLSALSEVPQYL